MDKIAVVILNGGQSQRFGSDKWASVFNGRSLLQLALTRSKVIASNIYISVNSESQRQMMEETHKGDLSDVKFILDDPSLTHIAGPLRGIISAVKQIPSEYLLFHPIDYPNLSPFTIKLILNSMKELSIDCITISLPSNHIASTVLAIRTVSYLKRMEILENLPTSRLSGLFRVSISCGFLYVLSDTIEFANLNKKEDADTIIIGPVPSRFGGVHIIRPENHYLEYLSLQKKTDMNNPNLIEEQLRKEFAIWKGIQWIASHIESDIRKEGL